MADAAAYAAGALASAGVTKKLKVDYTYVL